MVPEPLLTSVGLLECRLPSDDSVVFLLKFLLLFSLLELGDSAIIEVPFLCVTDHIVILLAQGPIELYVSPTGVRAKLLIELKILPPLFLITQLLVLVSSFNLFHSGDQLVVLLARVFLYLLFGLHSLLHLVFEPAPLVSEVLYVLFLILPLDSHLEGTVSIQDVSQVISLSGLVARTDLS